jgi:hypothetical protein
LRALTVCDHMSHASRKVVAWSDLAQSLTLSPGLQPPPPLSAQKTIPFGLTKTAMKRETGGS